MILEIEIVDPKAPKGTPNARKLVNTRYVAEVDPIYEPASEDDATLIQVGTSIVMHSGKKHRTPYTTTKLSSMMGGRA